jgi:hypothetical protein
LRRVISEPNIGFPTRLRPSDREGEWPVWGMKSGSRPQA